MTKRTVIVNLSFFLALTFLFSSCDIGPGIEGDGNVVTQSRTVSTFDKIDVSGSFTMILKQGDKESVDIVADENLHDIINTEVVGKTLIIDADHNIRRARSKVVYITFVDLDEIEIAGAITLKNDSPLHVGQLFLTGRGASTIDIEMVTNILDAKFSGANTVSLAGEAGQFNIRLSGASTLNAFEFSADEMEINVSGASDARITANKKLKVSISGAGSIVYQGDPEIEKTISGAGSVKKR
jgi:hypothetical protein